MGIAKALKGSELPSCKDEYAGVGDSFGTSGLDCLVRLLEFGSVDT